MSQRHKGHGRTVLLTTIERCNSFSPPLEKTITELVTCALGSQNISSGCDNLIKQGMLFGCFSDEALARLTFVFSKQVGEALAIFRARAVFRPELARAMFWKSKIVEASGEVGEARKLRGQSLAMYREITHKALPADSEPPEDVFDEVVAFWSR